MASRRFLSLAAGSAAALAGIGLAFWPGESDPRQSQAPAAEPLEVARVLPAAAPVTTGGAASGRTGPDGSEHGSAVAPATKRAPTTETAPTILERLTFGSRFYDPAATARPELAVFANWTQRYLTAPNPQTKAALTAEGVILAQARREVFASLIRTDPAGALATAVPVTVREQLPAPVNDRLEERVSGRGDLHVYATTASPGGPAPAEPTFRTVTMAERSYRAYVFGRREGQSSKRDISLAGVALDGALALSAGPVRVQIGRAHV